MRELTDDELATMSIDDAAAYLGNAIYEAARLAEDLEYTKKGRRVVGNGHHLRQQMAAACVAILRDSMERV